MMDNFHFKQEERIWGILSASRPMEDVTLGGSYAPQKIRDWRSAFRQWATEYSLYLIQNKPIIVWPSIVIHPPDISNDGRVTVQFVVSVLRHNNSLDLNDPLIYTFWLDFINDHQVRSDYWDWWKKNRGEFHSI